MAAEEEREPLLVNAQPDSIEVVEPTPRQKVQELYESKDVLGKHSPYRGNAADGSTINIITPSRSFQNLSVPDHIVAIFVVAFDTKAGNLLKPITTYITVIDPS